MKKFLIGLASVMALSAQAQTQPGGLRGLVGLGVTVGGDTIGTLYYTNGDSAKLTAGGTVDFRGGAEYQLIGQPVSLELSIGYHSDRVNAKNGDASFTRFPLELIGHYAFNESWRMGLGVRKSLNTKLDVSFDGTNTKFTSSVGPLIELEYFVTPQFSLKGRYVTETYTSDDSYKDKLNGDHAGFYAMFYF